MKLFTFLFLFCCVLISGILAQKRLPGVENFNDTVTHYLGQSVLLQCKVFNRGNNTVIWEFLDHGVTISKNLQILIQSDRFSVERPQYAGQDTDNSVEYLSLEIRDIQASDRGHYRCHMTGGLGLTTYDLDIQDAVIPLIPSVIPEANHTDCCLAEQVSTACLPLCDRAQLDVTFNPQVCTADVVKLIKCGTGGRNHLSCCRRSQVPTKCLEICTSGSPTIGVEQYGCELYDPIFNSCYNEGRVTIPTPPMGVSAIGIPQGMSLEWLPPKENADLVTGYRVFYKLASSTLPIFQTTEILGPDTRSKVLSMSTRGEYQIYVTAISAHGSSQPSSITQVFSGPVTDPNSEHNTAIKSCCVKQHVNTQCEALCRTDGYRSLDPVNVLNCQSNLPDIFHCISGGQDHRNCCRAEGISDQCLGLCSGQVTKIDQSFASCLLQIETIESCLIEGFDVLPASPLGVRVDYVDWNSATVRWNQAYANNNPVDSYIIRYKVKTSEGQTESQEISTEGLFAILAPLHPDTVYEATVTSLYNSQASLASPTMIFQTYTESDISSNLPEANKTDTVPVLPNMAECCENKKVPPECLWICSYHLDFHEILKHNATELSVCSAHMKNMLTCASDHRDHTTCCEASLVPTDCLFMCALMPGEDFSNFTYDCQLHSGNILNCYKEGVVSLPGSPENITVLNITSRAVTLDWDAPLSRSSVSEYVVQYTAGTFTEAVNVPRDVWREDKTNRTFHILQNLHPNTDYVIAIISTNENGSSIPRSYVVDRTMPENTIEYSTPAPGTTMNPVYVIPTAPPENRTHCCERKGLEGVCLSECEQGYNYENTTCTQHIFSIIACGSDGANHVSCCQTNQVPQQCQGLCQGQTNMEDTSINLFCASYVNIIAFCLQRKSVSLPSQPINVRVEAISSRTMRLLWDPPRLNCQSCSYYIYYARFKTAFMTAPEKIETSSTQFLLSRLLPDNLYQVYIVAWNKYGVSQPSSKFVYRTQPEAELQAHIKQDPIGIIEVGEKVEFYCVHKGAPYPISYKWWLNAHMIHIGQFLTINNASRANEGWYTCELDNFVEKDKDSRYLAMRYKPEVVYIKGDSRPPNEGYTAILTCMFKGHPLQVSWKKDGAPINEDKVLSSRSREVLSNGTTIAQIEIGVITEEDYGHYSCEGINTFGSATGIVELSNSIIVLPTSTPVTPPDIDLPSCCRRKGVLDRCMDWCSVDVDHSAIMNQVSHSPCQESFYIIMECMADRRDSTKCCQTSRIQDTCIPLCSGTPVNPVKLENTYCLRSSRRIFQCFNHSQVTLPTPPENFQSVYAGRGRLSLSWTAPVKNQDTVTFYHLFVMKEKESRPKQTSLGRSFTSYALNLTENGVYHIWLVAGNSNGQSIKTPIKELLVKDLYASAPEDLHGQAISMTSISLSWNHPDFVQAELKNYVIFYKTDSEDKFTNHSTKTVVSMYVIENVLPNTEYEIYVRSNNSYGLGEKSNIIYVNSLGKQINDQQTADESWRTYVGVGVAIVIILIIALIAVSVYFVRMRRPTLKQPGAVSFENPSYYETNNPIQISGMRNDVSDSTLQPTDVQAGYDQPNGQTKESSPSHTYASIDSVRNNSNGVNSPDIGYHSEA